MASNFGTPVVVRMSFNSLRVYKPSPMPPIVGGSTKRHESSFGNIPNTLRGSQKRSCTHAGPAHQHGRETYPRNDARLAPGSAAPASVSDILVRALRLSKLMQRRPRSRREKKDLLLGVENVYKIHALQVALSNVTAAFSCTVRCKGYVRCRNRLSPDSVGHDWPPLIILKCP